MKGRAFELAKAFGAPAITGVKPARGLHAPGGQGGRRRRAGVRGRPGAAVRRTGDPRRRARRPAGHGADGHAETGAVKPARSPRWSRCHRKWERAPQGGILPGAPHHRRRGGAGEASAFVSDPFGEAETPVSSPMDGIVVGRTNLPVVNRGDALCHIAEIMGSHDVERKLGTIEDELTMSPLFDEDEIL